MASSRAATRPAIWRGLAIVALFSLLTVAFTWPQAQRLSTQVIAHHDPLFSIWRLAWVAHQVVADPANLFEGNIYFPAHRTLAYSDAMLLPGLIALPLIRAGLSPLLVMNLLWLGAMVASGAGMYLLARRLTGSTGAAIVAGIIFTFAPYRVAHFHHLELQWAQWMPLAFWALHRAMTEGRLRDGVLTGVFVTCQLLSSIYYAIFLALTLAVAGGVLLVLHRSKLTSRSVAGLAIGALIVVGIAGPYSGPYRRNLQQVGTRDTTEIELFSATATNYLATPRGNYLYGDTTGYWSRSEETVLFPGLVPIALLLLALVPPICATRGVYLLALVFVVEMSFGWNGWLYRGLYQVLSPLQGLRAPGRFGILTLLTLGVLAAFGTARLERLVPRRTRSLVPLVLGALLCVEYATAAPPFEQFPTTPPPVYRWLAKQPPARVLELPFPTLKDIPLYEAVYMYFSTMHWQTLVNGYSGHYPPRYLELMETLSTFPDAKSLAELRAREVDVIIIHRNLFGRNQSHAQAIVEALQARPDMQLVATWMDHRGEAVAFRFFRGTPPAR
jgi:hypothetical protein